MRGVLACAVAVLLLLSPPAGVHTVDASDQLAGQGTQWSFENGVNQCINRVSTMPKAQAYRSLCSNVESLYEQNQQSTNTILALQVEAAQFRDRDLAQARAIQTEEQQLQVLERARQQEDRSEKRQERRLSLLERALRAARQTERQQVSSFQRKERELEFVQQQSMVLHQQSMMLHHQAEEEFSSTEARIALDTAERDKEIRAKVNEAKAKWEQQWAQHWAAFKPKLAALRKDMEHLENENAALRKEMAKTKLKGKNQEGLLEQLRALQTENAHLVKQCG